MKKKNSSVIPENVLREDLDRWRNFSSNMVQFLGHFFLDIISIVRPPGGTPCYCNLPCETEYQDAIILFSEIKFCIELENMFSNV